MHVRLPSPTPPPEVTASIPGLQGIESLPSTFSLTRRIACWLAWRAPLVRYVTRWLVGVESSPYRYYVVMIDPRKAEQAKDFLRDWQCDNLSPDALDALDPRARELIRARARKDSQDEKTPLGGEN